MQNQATLQQTLRWFHAVLMTVQLQFGKDLAKILRRESVSSRVAFMTSKYFDFYKESSQREVCDCREGVEHSGDASQTYQDDVTYCELNEYRTR